MSFKSGPTGLAEEDQYSHVRVCSDLNDTARVTHTQSAVKEGRLERYEALMAGGTGTGSWVPLVGQQVLLVEWIYRSNHVPLSTA